MRKKRRAFIFLAIGLSALIFSDMATAETQKKTTKSQEVKASRTIKA